MKKISLSILSCLLFSCSVPVQNISQNMDKTEIKNDKPFETKSLARFEHPNSRAELNDLAYDYAYTDITSSDHAVTHYAHARNYEYQGRIRSTEYFLALKCIAEGFDEQSYRDANPDVQAQVNAGTLPSGYSHYRIQGRTYEPGRVTTQTYKDKLKLNKVFREQAYFNANPGLHPGIRFTLDNNFTSTAYSVNGYENYVLSRYAGNNTLNTTAYQTALNDHVNGFWEDSYLYAFNDILNAADNNLYGITTGYSHYNPAGRNENRLAQTAYINALNVGIHPGESKAIEFEEGILGSSNPPPANQKRIYSFNVLPNRKYRFLLSEMSEGDGYLTVKNSGGNIIYSNDDTYGLDSYIEFTSPTSGITRYTVEVTTSNNGIPSTTPAGKFILTMFHVFKN